MGVIMRIDDRGFQKEMRAFARKSDGDFKRAVLKATLQMERLAKQKVRNMTQNARVKSSNLVNSIYKQITGNGLTGAVISAASYSQAYEEGTRPHTIRARGKKVLAGPLRGAPPGWEVSKKSRSMGYATYGKKIQHPGTQPHPFMFPAWKFACQELEKYIREALR
jgi:hypothetical protein